MVHKFWTMNHGWCQFKTEIEVRNPMKEYWDGDRVSTIQFTLMIIWMEKIRRNGMSFTKIIKSANRKVRFVINDNSCFCLKSMIFLVAYEVGLEALGVSRKFRMIKNFSRCSTTCKSFNVPVPRPKRPNFHGRSRPNLRWFIGSRTNQIWSTQSLAT